MKNNGKTKATSKITILFFAISVIFAASCFISCNIDIFNYPFGTDNNPYDPNQDNNGDNNNYPEFPQDNTDNEEMKNLILYIDFDSHNDNQFRTSNGKITEDIIFRKRNNVDYRAPLVLKESHGNVYELKADSSGSYLEKDIYVSGSATLTFQFKADVCRDNMLNISVDGINSKVEHKGNGDGWCKASVALSPNKHTIKWYIPRQYSYSPSLENVIYIDNITVAPNKVEYIDIYPKGLQETYVGGDSIKFTALPLRGDRSFINENVTYSVSGCGTIDRNGVFIPTSKGTCTVTATAGGKVVRKTDIYVHGTNYLEDSVKIAGHTFTGNVSLKTYPGSNLDTGNTTFEYPETPAGVNFNADGFFILKGNATKPLWIEVIKNDAVNPYVPDDKKQKGETEYKTNFFIRKQGAFYKRIWLRFGSGDYTVKIIEIPQEKFNMTRPVQVSGKPFYEGDILSLGGSVVKTLNVTNTNNISLEEALWIMPSEVVQSDDFIVSNIAHSILGDLPANATNGDKLRAIHDWEIRNFYYDNISVNHPEQRKRQDAAASVMYGTAVCEGYANLYAALVRIAGIPAKVICENEQLNHAWNHIFYKNGWYLVDVTWDDPVSDTDDSYNDIGPSSENYTYFMTSPTDDKHIAPGYSDTGRSLIQEEQAPEMTGMPKGWY